MENSVINTAIFVLGKISLGFEYMTLFGSVTSFIIFSRKAFKKSSIGIYCRSLAIFDLYVIYDCAIGTLMMLKVIISTDILCKIQYYISTGFSSMPGWVLVFFSFDQLIIVSRTERFKFFNKRWFRYSIIIGIFIIQCVIYAPALFLTGLRFYSIGNNLTSTSCDSLSLIMPIIYLIESCLIPFGLIIFSTTLIVRILIKSRQKISANLQLTAQMARRNQEYKFAFNSVVLNVLFIVLTFPLLVSYILPVNKTLVFTLVQKFLYDLFYLNFALHFWVHLASNSVFRNEILKVLRIKRANNNNTRFSLTLSQKNGSQRNGSLRNGSLRNGSLRNGSLRNG